MPRIGWAGGCSERDEASGQSDNVTVLVGLNVVRDRRWIGTAYFANSCGIAAEIAELLDGGLSSAQGSVFSMSSA